MVCPVGSGKMAVLARVLAGGGFSNTAEEEVSHQKLLAQHIFKEFRDTDEANLLDEEDMHVYGLKPMADQLHLVCCNACKKPIKASQYMAHQDICRLLNSTQEAVLEPNGTGRGKRPPRKERKKSTTPKQGLTIGEQGNYEFVKDTITVEPQFRYNGNQQSSSLCLEVKGNSTSQVVPRSKDDPGVIPRNADESASQMHPPVKRSRLIAGEHMSETDDRETDSGRDFQKESLPKQEAKSGCAIDYKNPLQIYTNSQLTQGTPVPLASKIYYSQRSNRLRSAIGHLYYMTSTDGLLDDLELRDAQPSPLLQEPDPVLSKSSLRSDIAAVSLPPSKVSNYLSADAALRPQDDPIQLMKGRTFPNGYSFAGDSGKPLSVQQPDGSVSVS
ncbi:uncharacterized protein LOC130135855 isoform X1 [Syzygium oleosum]|uniref:uncharacterized protein LOC130135855 isoform X1 n=1 Tax=Syzygium oleosum TaxID=219896 RepID=UPI0024B91DD5|nr:uncharacterized protein LOC130135855 isoform X1 [Syzygium oleosum]XP_056161636.1 uncharacterized protein LOC130135855 isoform X1 [Syzygium oleosum]XP_056161637.1 uncharacterized protein LOC130135855 isoform X1 [Syzygium oleosum]